MPDILEDLPPEMPTGPSKPELTYEDEDSSGYTARKVFRAGTELGRRAFAATGRSLFHDRREQKKWQEIEVRWPFSWIDYRIIQAQKYHWSLKALMKAIDSREKFADWAGPALRRLEAEGGRWIDEYAKIERIYHAQTPEV